MQDTKAGDGSVYEKDTQIGASEEIEIDPVAEKKVDFLDTYFGIID